MFDHVIYKKNLYILLKHKRGYLQVLVFLNIYDCTHSYHVYVVLLLVMLCPPQKNLKIE